MAGWSGEVGPFEKDLESMQTKNNNMNVKEIHLSIHMFKGGMKDSDHVWWWGLNILNNGGHDDQKRIKSLKALVNLVHEASIGLWDR